MPPTLTLLSRPGCHLCHEMQAEVERAIRGSDVALELRNIDEDEALRRRYALLIPVLLLGETEIARYRVDAAALRERLRTLAG